MDLCGSIPIDLGIASIFWFVSRMNCIHPCSRCRLCWCPEEWRIQLLLTSLQLLDYLIDDNLMVEVWGQQKEDGYKSGITGSSDKNRSPSKNVLAHGQSKEGGIQSGQRETLDANTAAATGAVPAVKQSGQGAATATDSSSTVVLILAFVAFCFMPLRWMHYIHPSYQRKTVSGSKTSAFGNNSL